MRYIFDASAVLAYFQGERGGEEVREIFKLPAGSCCMHSANWVEFYYKLFNKSGIKAVNKAIEELFYYKVSVTEICDDTYRTRVAEVKINHPFLSLGDCHAIALSSWIGGILVTSDRHIFAASSFTNIKMIR